MLRGVVPFAFLLTVSGCAVSAPDVSFRGRYGVAELGGVLLGPGDLPDGYEQVEGSTPPTPSPSEAPKMSAPERRIETCLGRVDRSRRDRVAPKGRLTVLSADFSDGMGVISSSAENFASVAAAKAEFALLRNRKGSQCLVDEMQRGLRQAYEDNGTVVLLDDPVLYDPPQYPNIAALSMNATRRTDRTAVTVFMVSYFYRSADVITTVTLANVAEADAAAATSTMMRKTRHLTGDISADLSRFKETALAEAARFAQTVSYFASDTAAADGLRWVEIGLSESAGSWQDDVFTASNGCTVHVPVDGDRITVASDADCSSLRP